MSIRLPNSCFVHIPRTGGVWFREIVKASGIKHRILIGDYDSHLTWSELPESWKGLTAFSFVRHPLAWVKSRWSHCIEHNYHKDYAFFGVHRLFDECVRPTLVETAEWLIKNQPGLVGFTYKEMLGDNVDILYRTEDLPLAAYEVLHRLEEVPQEFKAKVLAAPIVNSTVTLSRYKKEIGALPKGLVEELLRCEKQALSIWESATRVEGDQ